MLRMQATNNDNTTDWKQEGKESQLKNHTYSKISEFFGKRVR